MHAANHLERRLVVVKSAGREDVVVFSTSTPIVVVWKRVDRLVEFNIVCNCWKLALDELSAVFLVDVG